MRADGRRHSRRSTALCAAGAALVAACGGVPASGGSALVVPGSVSLAVVEGDPNPPARTVVLTNRGSCPLALTIEVLTTDGAAWLSVSPQGGEVPPSVPTPLMLSFDPLGTRLVPGTYTGSVVLSGTCTTAGQPARGSPRAIAVNLSVTAAESGGQGQWIAFDGAVLPTARTRGAAAAALLFTQNNLYRSVVFGGVDGAGTPLAAPFIHEVGVGWTALAGLPDEPAARVAHTVTAFTSEFAGVMVWGGLFTGGTPTQTGARLIDDFGTLVWQTVTLTGAPSARHAHTVTWAQPHLVVFGGFDAGGNVLGDGGRHIPDADQWLALSTTSAPSARARHLAVYDDLDDIVVWGGEGAGGALTNTGGRLNPFTNSWRGMSTIGAPSARAGMTGVWSGTQMVVWGGRDAAGVTSDGAAYDPFADTWAPVATQGAPSAREEHTAVWTGTQMIVWGGRDGAGNPLGDGAAYDPATNQWSAVATAGAPIPRAGHVATWENDRMLVVTGETATGATDTGKAYR